MQRTTTTDAGSRYQVTIPFARELAADERDGVARALETATFGRPHRYSDDPINTTDVTVTETEARVTVRLPYDDDHNPAGVKGQLYAAVGEWHGRAGPLTEPTRAGGESTLAALDAAALETDREPDGDGPHTYLLAYPDRPLTDEEVTLLEHVTDADSVVSPAFVALVDAVALVYDHPARRALGRLREDLGVPVDHDLRGRYFFPTREVGTLAAVDEAGRTALAERGRQQSPHSTPDDAASDNSEVNA